MSFLHCSRSITKYKLESTPLLKVNNNQETYINLKKFAMGNVQYSVKESRQRAFLQTEQSATLKSSLICSPILRLLSTGDNIYQWTTKQRDRTELPSFFFTKTQALSCQKSRKNKYKYACGLMTEQTHTPTQVMTPTSTPHVNNDLRILLPLSRSSWQHHSSA